MCFLLRSENIANMLYSHHPEYPGHSQLPGESSQLQCGPYRQPNEEGFCRSVSKHTHTHTHTQSGMGTNTD